MIFCNWLLGPPFSYVESADALTRYALFTFTKDRLKLGDFLVQALIIEVIKKIWAEWMNRM